METTIMGPIIWGLYRDNGKENGNYKSGVYIRAIQG